MEVHKIDSYIEACGPWKEGMKTLRAMLLDYDFEESIKWGRPTYSMDGKNLIGISAFKHHFGIWFFQGVFLTDPMNILSNAQEGKTKAMRQVKFTNNADVNTQTLKPYIEETIANHKAGKKVSVSRKSKVLPLPEILKEALDEQGSAAFQALSQSKKNEYIEYITSAKRMATKASRIEKILPMIMEGKGLNDQYK